MAQTDCKIPSVIAQEILDSDCSNDALSDSEVANTHEETSENIISLPHKEDIESLVHTDNEVQKVTSPVQNATTLTDKVDENVTSLFDISETNKDSPIHEISSDNINSPINNLSNEDESTLLSEQDNSIVELPNAKESPSKEPPADSGISTKDNVLIEGNEAQIKELSEREDCCKSPSSDNDNIKEVLSDREDCCKSPSSENDNSKEVLSDREDCHKSPSPENDSSKEVIQRALIHEEMLVDSDEDEDSLAESNAMHNSKEQISPLKISDEDIKKEPIDSKSDDGLLVNGEEHLPSEVKVEKGSVKIQKKKVNSTVNTKTTKPKFVQEFVGLTDDDEYVPKGWTRRLVQRQGGISAGKYDVYYTSPLGKRLRSSREVVAYVEKMAIDVNMLKFSFTHPPIAARGSSHGLSTPKSLGGASNKRKLPSNNKDGVSELGLSLPKKIKLSPSSPKKSSSKSLRSPVGKVRLVSAAKTAHQHGETVIPPTQTMIPKGLLRLKGSNPWEPPRSPFNMYQEKLYKKPWQMLVATIFFQKTSGDDELGRNVLAEFLENWSTPELLLAAEKSLITDVVKPLGNPEKRVNVLLRFSDEYLHTNWTYPKELYGIGKYGNDSYRVFCVSEWRKVKATDYLLTFYIDWLWDNHKYLQLE